MIRLLGNPSSQDLPEGCWRLRSDSVRVQSRDRGLYWLTGYIYKTEGVYAENRGIYASLAFFILRLKRSLLLSESAR